MSCVDGKYNNEFGGGTELSCRSNCGAGSYITENKDACKHCPKGYWQATAKQSDCNSCGIGTYNDQLEKKSLNDCKYCVAGQYQNELKSESCKQCEEGKYTDEKKQT